MIVYKDIIEKLKRKGYTRKRIREDKIMGQSTYDNLRTGGVVNTNTLNTLCELLQCQPGEIIEWVPDEKKEGKKMSEKKQYIPHDENDHHIDTGLGYETYEEAYEYAINNSPRYKKIAIYEPNNDCCIGESDITEHVEEVEKIKKMFIEKMKDRTGEKEFEIWKIEVIEIGKKYRIETIGNEYDVIEEDDEISISVEGCNNYF